jgi:hypothetical protein
MNPILTAGLFIGIFCGLWTFVMGFMGWYTDPVMARAFYVVIVIQVVGLVWGLRQTAQSGRTWASQVVAGTMMSVIAGIIVILALLLFTTVAFPEFFDELERRGIEAMQQQNATEAQINDALASSRVWATPMSFALGGFVATLITGIVASAALAVVIRAKPIAQRRG